MDIVHYHLIRNWEKIGLFGAGLGLGFKSTRKVTWNVVRWTATSVARPIAIGVGTAALNILRYPVLIAATGYTIGATAGTLISEAIWGESGKEDAVRLYTGQVSWTEYWNTVGEGLEVFLEDLGVI